MLTKVHGVEKATEYLAGLDLELAMSVIDRAIEFAATMGERVVVAVSDSGGNLVALKRMDQSYIGSIGAAIAKAACSAQFRRSTRVFAEGGHTVLSLPGVIAVEGGVPLMSGKFILGAVGVSGAAPAVDGEIALEASTIVSTP